MRVIFDVRHLYYLPQFLPVYEQLKRQSVELSFVFYHSDFDSVVQDIIEAHQLAAIWVTDEKASAQYYLEQKATWVIFGNGYTQLETVHKVSKSVQLGHGIGPKTSYYTKSNDSTTVRFVEGAYRTQRLEALYPQDNFVDVGFCKLDPVLNGSTSGMDLQALGLDPKKPTLVYAPTFYPSSIERFSKRWPKEFAEYNILIKPHYFSLSKKRYKKQKKLLTHWRSYDNVYLAQEQDYSLLPFLATADVLISDASSALFEFAALNKPIVWCDFLKLRWSYRSVLRFRFNNRMDEDYEKYADIGIHARSYKSLKTIVNSQINHPAQYAKQRLDYAEQLAGRLDGKASERIVEYLMMHKG